MPVSRPVYKRCTCEECIEKGGYVENGAPRGVLIAERLMAAHLQRTQRGQAEHAALAHVAGSGHKNDGADLVTSLLRTLTLAENDALTAVPARTGAVPGSPEYPSPTPPVPISTLTHDLERLTLSDSFAREPIGTTVGGGHVFQRDSNRRTVKALKVLDNIGFRVQRCFRLLFAGNPEYVGRELPLLRKAVENIKREVDLVIARKGAIMLEIDALEAQFNICRPPERDSRTAVNFDAGKILLS